MVFSIAMLSIHTSPLDKPGQTKDAGGMNVYMRELARELGQRGILIDIFTRRTSEQQPKIVKLAPNVRVIHIAAGPAAQVPKNELFQYVAQFSQHIHEFTRQESLEYDLIHSHYWLSGLAAIPLANRWDVPHVTMFHTIARLKQLANPNEPESTLRIEMEQKLMQQADRVIAATQDERNHIIRYCGLTSRKVEVIPCGVDLARFSPQPRAQARSHWGLDTQKPVIMFVGRLDPFKGPDLLLKAASLMQEDAQLVIVGGKLSGDPELTQLRKQAKELKISQRTHFLGAQPQSELPGLYSAADILIVPSYHEIFGMAAVESLACGTPVVATRAGGLMTIIENGVNGYLVPRCPGFFAERLDTLLTSPHLLQEMQAAARPSIEQFSWKEVANQVYDLYDTLLEESSCLAAL